MTSFTFGMPDPANLNITLAYLDPGTGSILFSVIIATVSSLYYILRSLYYKILSLIFGRMLHGDGQIGTNHRLVLYSEGSQYADLFMPLLRELELRRQPCLYLTGSQSDPSLSLASDTIQVKYIGLKAGAWTLLKNLRADVCVMTTPGLDVLQIKRSKKVKHYAHIIHSPTDKSFNRTYSFDYYDSVLISGKHQQKTLRTLEALRRQPEKQMLLTGCVYYDELKRKKDNGSNQASSSRADRVLVAPTWGKNGLMSGFGMSVIRKLVDDGFCVTMRPHPQSWISEKDLLRPYQELADRWPDFKIDDSDSPMESMRSAAVMISDISGVIFDFAFLFERPVITIRSPIDKRGFEAQDLPFEPWELTVLEKIGCVVGEEDIEDLPEIVRRTTDKAADNKMNICALRDQYVVNFGRAASPTADAIQKLLTKENQMAPVRAR